MYQNPRYLKKRKRRSRRSLVFPGILAAVVILAGCMRLFINDAAAGSVAAVEPSASDTAPAQTQPPTEETDPIDAAMDAVLETLVWDGATDEEIVRTIYAWVRSRISYGGHSDRTDYRQAAYTTLQECRGDCYGYFALTKLLFERLGIPNIDVQKVKNSEDDSEHFWSLVSVDGGETYYHFDATPRIGEGDDFCLVTDTFLDAYSDTHDGSHNRDKTLYPATPEE